MANPSWGRGEGPWKRWRRTYGGSRYYNPREDPPRVRRDPGCPDHLLDTRHPPGTEVSVTHGLRCDGQDGFRSRTTGTVLVKTGEGRREEVSEVECEPPDGTGGPVDQPTGRGVRWDVGGPDTDRPTPGSPRGTSRIGRLSSDDSTMSHLLSGETNTGSTRGEVHSRTEEEPGRPRRCWYRPVEWSE